MIPLAGPANRQGRIAADNICGRQETYTGSLGTGIATGATGSGKSTTLAAMIDTNEEGYGLGISRLLEPPVDDVEIYGNGGGVVGYKSVALYETGTGTTIIAMTPTGHGLGDAQTRAIEWAFGR